MNELYLLIVIFLTGFIIVSAKKRSINGFKKRVDLLSNHNITITEIINEDDED